MTEKLFQFIEKSPTAFHAVDTLKNELKENGFCELFENEKWELALGGTYFVTRNFSSLIAFKIPKNGFHGYMIAAAHSDSPCFKIKENGELSSGKYTSLSTEKYGGMLCSTWLDRPLGVAGRVVVETENGVETKLVNSQKSVAVIPNVAIHMNRNANDGASFNAAVDMLPLYSSDSYDGGFNAYLSKLCGVPYEKILGSDIYVYNTQKGEAFNNLICAPRLDDLQCVFSAKEAFLSAENGVSVPVLAVFDNEEVGSGTKQGAASTFLSDILERINLAFKNDKEDFISDIADSFMLSCDNAHAVHPNHGEYADRNHSVYMNGGVVIKYNANQKYTTDAFSAALFKKIAKKAGVPTQSYCNRADMPGGSTLGNISNTVVSLNTADIGLAQLAMHSAFETAGADDTEYMVKALKVFFASTVKNENEAVVLS